MINDTSLVKYSLITSRKYKICTRTAYIATGSQAPRNVSGESSLARYGEKEFSTRFHRATGAGGALCIFRTRDTDGTPFVLFKRDCNLKKNCRGVLKMESFEAEYTSASGVTRARYPRRCERLSCTEITARCSRAARCTPLPPR